MVITVPERVVRLAQGTGACENPRQSLRPASRTERDQDKGTAERLNVCSRIVDPGHRLLVAGPGYEAVVAQDGPAAQRFDGDVRAVGQDGQPVPPGVGDDSNLHTGTVSVEMKVAPDHPVDPEMFISLPVRIDGEGTIPDPLDVIRPFLQHPGNAGFKEITRHRHGSHPEIQAAGASSQG